MCEGLGEVSPRRLVETCKHVTPNTAFVSAGSVGLLASSRPLNRRTPQAPNGVDPHLKSSQTTTKSSGKANAA